MLYNNVAPDSVGDRFFFFAVVHAPAGLHYERDLLDLVFYSLSLSLWTFVDFYVVKLGE